MGEASRQEGLSLHISDLMKQSQRKTVTEWGLAVLLLVMSVSCAKQRPQIPSNRPDQTEQQEQKTAQNLAQANQIAAQQALDELRRYADACAEPYQSSDLGYMYRHYPASQARQQITDTTTLIINYWVYSLQDSLCGYTSATVQMGRKQIPEAIEDMLLQMQRGDSATLLVPWYLLYGRSGNGLVAPYMQTRVELSAQ